MCPAPDGTDRMSGTVSILYGKGDLTFPRSKTLSGLSQPNWVTIADVNNDRRPDILVTNYTDASGNVSVYLNTGQ